MGIFKQNNMAKKTKLENSIAELLQLVQDTNEKIKELGVCDDFLYSTLVRIQTQFDTIRGIPDDQMLEYNKIKEVCITWKQHVDKINENYINAQKANVGFSAAGITGGAGVALLGPTAAMGIATTYGVASTGTAIATLHGAAATNAALAWLGGGTLAAGGGGMSAGSMFLGLAGPVGWTIVGLTLVSSVLLFWKAKSDKKRLEDVFFLVNKRDKCSYNLALVELNERIKQIKKENSNLQDAIERISTFGTDYTSMTEEQKYKLGLYVNLMNASAQLLINPILGLQPKYCEIDFDRFIEYSPQGPWLNIDVHKRELIIYMANFLYGIETEKSDRKLLSKSFRNNKEFIKKMGIEKDHINSELFDIANDALEFSYSIS